MNRSMWLAVGLSVVSAGALAETAAVRGDFAYGIPISTTETAAAYRVAIPVDVYAKSTHEDLRDVRIFNAAGEVVPYEIQQAPSRVARLTEGPSLPLFALRADSRPSLDGLRVTIQSSGTAVNLQAGATPAQTATINSYLLDARQIALPLYALQLRWPDDAADFTGSVRVESSDDLQSWHAVASDSPVVNLHGSGAHLVRNHIDLGGSRAKFWRLTWIGRAAPFEVTSVTAQTNPDRREPQSLSLTVNGSAVSGNTREYSFDLGAQLPITKIELVLPEANSVAKAQLLSRKQPGGPWCPIGSGDFFRMRDGASERHNAPVEIGRDSDRFWLARFDQTPGAAAGTAPQLQVTWDAQDIVFLARGAGPYQLAYGSGVATAASIPLASLLGGMGVVRAMAGAPVALGGADRLLPPPRTVPWKMAVLWSVLGIGMLLLALMAYRPSRELANQPARRD
jgi:hypothetical protein